MTIDLNAMLAKRAEVLGEGNKFDVKLGDKTFYFVAPELASSEWNDRHQAFLEDIRDGLMTSETAREEFLGLARSKTKQKNSQRQPMKSVLTHSSSHRWHSRSTPNTWEKPNPRSP